MSIIDCSTHTIAQSGPYCQGASEVGPCSFPVGDEQADLCDSSLGTYPLIHESKGYPVVVALWGEQPAGCGIGKYVSDSLGTREPGGTRLTDAPLSLDARAMATYRSEEGKEGNTQIAVLYGHQSLSILPIV
jgi:hypothetical protein